MSATNMVYQIYPGGRIILRAKRSHYDVLPVDEAIDRLAENCMVYVAEKDGYAVILQQKEHQAHLLRNDAAGDE